MDYRKCDLLDAEALRPHIEGVDAVLHLAAIPAPGRGPNAQIFQINTAGMFNVFDACAQQKVNRVVVASWIDACRAMQLSLTAEYGGSHPLLILD
ncbi:MAG: NAD-dependent epimerase/dehydratase family protein [Candidatus Latescibacterota bacterium]|nr:NAD-dependent epimerase/dehydratase family protein [Candidatus Latescibacterota bacterium]